MNQDVLTFLKIVFIMNIVISGRSAREFYFDGYNTGFLFNAFIFVLNIIGLYCMIIGA